MSSMKSRMRVPMKLVFYLSVTVSINLINKKVTVIYVQNTYNYTINSIIRVLYAFKLHKTIHLYCLEYVIIFDFSMFAEINIFERKIKIN